MILHVHPDNPQERLVRQAARRLDDGDVIIYPTDTLYGFGCDVQNKRAIDVLHQLKGADAKKPMAIICPDLSVLSEYTASMPTAVFRILKRLTPGPYTFVLEASNKVPKLMLSKQRSVGIRIPDNPICQMLVRLLERPIISTSVQLEGDGQFVEDPDEIHEQWHRRVPLVLGGGILVAEPSTVVDLTEGYPKILRHGKGDTSSLV